MKFIAYILIILIAGMATAPCADATDTCRSDMEQSVVQVSINHQHTDCDMEMNHDACSPLCPCQCCPTIDSNESEISALIVASPSPVSFSEKSRLLSIPTELIGPPPQHLS